MKQKLYRFIEFYRFSKTVARMIYQLNEDELAKAQAKMQEDNDRDLAAYAKMHEQQGYDKGVEIGVLKSKRETAKNLKELGVDIETIMKSTGLSKEEIEKL